MSLMTKGYLRTKLNYVFMFPTDVKLIFWTSQKDYAKLPNGLQGLQAIELEELFERERGVVK